MCLLPKLIKNKKYCSTKKNGGIIPAVSDKRALYVAVGCGRCMECLKQKAERLDLHAKYSKMNSQMYGEFNLFDESVS